MQIKINDDPKLYDIISFIEQKGVTRKDYFVTFAFSNIEDANPNLEDVQSLTLINGDTIMIFKDLKLSRIDISKNESGNKTVIYDYYEEVSQKVSELASEIYTVKDLIAKIEESEKLIKSALDYILFSDDEDLVDLEEDEEGGEVDE